MNLIVNVDENWAIGYKNQLLVKIPADMRFFRDETTNKIVVMGRKTFESFPSGQPLKNRTNIVITRNKNYTHKGITVVHSIDETLKLLKNYKSEDIYIIGGEKIYKQFLDYCDVAYVTKVDFKYQADAYFPNLDKLDWKIVGISEEQVYYDLTYKWYKYIKNS